MATLGSTFRAWSAGGLLQPGLGAFGTTATDVMHSGAHFLNLGSGVIGQHGSSYLSAQRTDTRTFYQESGTRFIHLDAPLPDEGDSALATPLPKELLDLAGEIQTTPKALPLRIFAASAESGVLRLSPNNDRGADHGDAPVQTSQSTRWRSAISSAAERIHAQYLSERQLKERRELVGLLEGMIGRYERLAGEGKIAPQVLKRISQRLAWNVAELPRLLDLWTETYHEHFTKRLAILSNMILDVAADAYWESAQDRFKVKFGKPLPIEAPPEDETRAPDRPRRPHTDGPRHSRGERIEGLINHDVGLGISLWRHQIEVLKNIQSAMSIAREEASDPELMTGYVVAATGSGKTRTMMASIAMCLKEGWFDPRLVDKCVIATHLNIIHDQNEDAARKLLNPLFRELIGRDVKVSTVGAGKGSDLTGDIVIVNIPAIGRAEAIRSFADELKQALGQTGEIPLVVLDEVHHGEAKTWQRFRETVQEISPGRYELGFTATPRAGMTGRRLANFPAMALIPEKVLPSVQLVPVATQINLDGLKTSKGDFTERQLAERVTNRQRNMRIFEAMERHGVMRTSPGGRLGFAPTLIFGVSLAHAHGSIARDFLEHFGEQAMQQTALRGRRLRLIGAKDGQWVAKGKSYAYELTPTSSEETRQAIEQYRNSEIDGVVAVVWGGMPKRSFDLIMEAFSKGEIEVVINCKKLEEGYDAPFVRNIVGAKPTLKGTQKTQEVGRILRWNEGEVDFQRGIIREDNPRMAFDVRDQFGRHGQVLWSYQEALGVVAGGRLAVGQAHDLRSLGNAAQLAGGMAESAAETDLSPIVLRLKEWLAERYAGDVDLMAYDLGLERHELAALLNINGLSEDRLFLEELATMLYLPREALAQLRHDASSPQIEAITDMLQRGLEIYFGLEGKRPHAFKVKDTRPGMNDAIAIKARLLKAVRSRRVTDRQTGQLALGLMIAFQDAMVRGNEEVGSYVRELMGGMDGAYTRIGWDASLHGIEGMDVDGFMRLAQGPWPDGKALHLVGQLTSNGRIQGLRLTEDVSGLSSHYFDIALVRSGNPLSVSKSPKGGYASKVLMALNQNRDVFVAPGLIEEVLAQERKSREAGVWRGKQIAPDDIVASDILKVWSERGDAASVLHLVGNLQSNGKIQGLRLSADVSGLTYKYFDITLERSNDGIRVSEAPKGQGAPKILAALSENRGMIVAPELLEKVREAGVWRGKAIARDNITTADILKVWDQRGDDAPSLHLIGLLRSNGKIRGLRLTEDVSGLISQYFDIVLVRSGNQLSVSEPPEGRGAFKVLISLSHNTDVIMPRDLIEEALAQERRAEEAGDWRGKQIAPDEIAEAEILKVWEGRGDDASMLHLVGNLQSDGKITGLRLTAEVSGIGTNYFDIALVRSGNQLRVSGPPRGTGASKVLRSLSQNRGVMLAPGLSEKILAQERKAVEAGDWHGKQVAPDAIATADILKVWEGRGGQTSSLHLVGALRSNGKISGLRLTSDVRRLNMSSFDITLERSGNLLRVSESPKGAYASKVLMGLNQNEEIIVAPELLEKAMEAGVWYGKAISPDDIEMADILKVWKGYGNDARSLHLVGSLRSDGKVTGLRLTEDVSGLTRGYFDITLVRSGEELSVSEPPKGHGASKILTAISAKRGVIIVPKLFEKAGEAGVWRGKSIALEDITLSDILRVWDERGDDAISLHLVGLLNKKTGKVTGLRLTADVSGLGYRYFDITLVRSGEELSVSEPPKGAYASKVLTALSTRGEIVIEDTAQKAPTRNRT